MSNRLQWQTVDVDEGEAQWLGEKLGIPRPLAVVLKGRGFSTPDDVNDFLTPRLSSLSDPFELPCMDEAVTRIHKALSTGEKIAVFGDYDADGVTSAALLVSVLERLGANVGTFLPQRIRDGYGLTPGALSHCIDEHSPSLVISVDCGTTSVEAVKAASEAGVDIVVTDHHEASHDIAPAVAVVNPKLGESRQGELLAGVGVAFKLCHALLKREIEDGNADKPRIDLREYLGLVAMGTVCDIVPLHGENRVLVHHGMRQLNDGPNSVGVKALRKVSGAQDRLQCYHLGFLLGPRLNAVGRLGSAMPALELLTTTDATRAASLAEELNAANADRKTIEKSILEDAISELESEFDETLSFGLCAGRETWDLGVVGIVASRLCRKYNRPSVVVAFDANGEGRGSCRSVQNVDLVEVLGGCSDLLESYGGHSMAAGVALTRDRMPAFKARFNELCAERLRGTDMRPVQKVDAWLKNLGEADSRLYEGLERMRPFGCGNPSPVWGVKHVRCVGQPRRVGADGAHLKLTLASGGTQMDAIGFGMGDIDLPDGAMDALFELDENRFRGNVSLQMRLKDLRESQGS